jgi:DNA-binding NtrC family response regulator
MYKIMTIESGGGPRLQALLLSVLDRPCLVRAMCDGAAADQALAQDEFHAVIIDMAIAGADPLLLAKHAAQRGCGTILVPDLPAQFHAAARGGHLILCKPLRAKRLLELVREACAGARPPDAA